MSDHKPARLAPLAFWLVVIAAGVAVASVLATRFGVVDFRGGLLGVAGAMLVVAIGAALGLVGVIRALGGKPGLPRAAIAAVLGLAVLALPVMSAVRGLGVPQIHDITTDLDTPPDFVAVVPLRGEGANPLDRSTPDLGTMQRKAYPQLQTLVVADDAATVFEAALAEAAARGWDVVDAAAPVDGEPGTIEATDTTTLFGFMDDVVIRIRDDGPGRTLVDLRSVSRVGQSDLGANAARIEAFQEALKTRL